MCSTPYKNETLEEWCQKSLAKFFAKVQMENEIKNSRQKTEEENPKSEEQPAIFTISEKIPALENQKPVSNEGSHGIVVTHPTSYLETLMHVFKGNIGSGMYAMGDAFKHGGLIFGSIMACFLGLISVHSQHLLLECNEKIVNSEKIITRPDFARTVEMCFEKGPKTLRKFATTVRNIVNVLLCVTQLGFCCVYFVFIGSNLQKVLESFDIKLDIHILMACAFLPILLVSLIKKLKYLAPFSAFANFLMVIGISITIYYASTDLPPVSSRRYIGNIQSLPLFFGTVIYAFEGIGLVVPLQNEMKEPKKFSSPFGVLNVGMVIITCLIVTVGFLGYLKWGDEVAGSLTLNFPQGEILSIVVQILLIFAIMFTYPVQLFVSVEPLMDFLRYGNCSSKPNNVLAEYALRTCLVLFTFTMAEVIPNLGLFISLIGAISSTTLALLIPPILELVSRSQDVEGIPVLVIIKNILIITIGLVGCVTGTYESIRAILETFLA